MARQASQFREYRRDECVSFRSTKGPHGGLSNMAGGFPLRVNGVFVPSTEALYQACRFPHNASAQTAIIREKSPMTAKMVSRRFLQETRDDWLAIRVDVMRWVLRVKLVQHWQRFSQVLLETGEYPIVEDSRNDDFWGAIRRGRDELVGRNILGRLLMELRETLPGKNVNHFVPLVAPDINDFLFLGNAIGEIHASTLASPELFQDPCPKPTEINIGKGIDVRKKRQCEASVSTASQVSDKEANLVGTYPKRLIEVDLPIARISAHARREKSIRHGHISTLHIWWARRPLAACRAVICAALWPDPADELCPQAFRDAAAAQLMAFAHRMFPKMINEEGHQLQSTASEESRGRWEGLLQSEKDGLPLDPTDPAHQQVLQGALLDFIADFANWDNSTVPAYLETSRALTQAAHEALGGVPGTRPLVVDPFAGGGSIPLEALRVGADAFASDLNPVAVLLNKVVLEYIPKYGQRLADEVRKWGQWVKEQAEQELAEYYPKDPDGATPIAYLWARTFKCEGPSCGAEIPMLNQMWIKKDGKDKYAFRFRHDGTSIEVEVICDPKPTDVQNGTAKQGAVTCPKCGYTNVANRVRQVGREGGIGTRMIGVVLSVPERTERRFRSPAKKDFAAFADACKQHSHNVGKFSELLDVDIPRTELRRISVPLYGMTKFCDLFLPRQRLAFDTLAKILDDANSVCGSGDAGLDAATHDVVSLVISNVLHYNMNLSTYLLNHMVSAFIQGTSLAMRSDFAEANPLMDRLVGGIDYSFAQVDRMLTSASLGWDTHGSVLRSSATQIQLPDDSVALVATDPPYYDSIPYSHLSDVFYIWLRAAAGSRHPADFAAELVEKADEIVEDRAHSQSPTKKGADFFEAGMRSAMSEARRVVSPSQMLLVVFAHKSTAGWEAMLSALIDSGWTVVGAWPIDTERSARMNAYQNASLLSSIHVACRPRENPDGSVRNDIGEWRDVLSELPPRIHDWMPRLAAEGVVGADAIFACLGPALEIFSRYSRVEKADGSPVPLKDYLEEVWSAVSTEALSMIFKDADAAGLEPDARLTAMWLWTLGGGTGKAGANGNAIEVVPGMASDDEGDDEEPSSGKSTASGGFTLEFDAARKIAQGLGVHLEQSDSIVEVKGDKARLLPVGERIRHLFGKDETTTATRGRKKAKAKQRSLFEELDALEAEAEETVAGELKPHAGETVLDRVHQSMILFASGRGEALRRFLVDDGAGKDARFWKLAQSLSALYPPGTDEKRWVDGVLARKKGLGL